MSVSCCSGGVANPLVRCASAVLRGIRCVAEREYVAMDSEESVCKAARVARNMLCSPGRGVAEKNFASCGQAIIYRTGFTTATAVVAVVLVDHVVELEGLAATTAASQPLQLCAAGKVPGAAPRVSPCHPSHDFVIAARNVQLLIGRPNQGCGVHTTLLELPLSTTLEEETRLKPLRTHQPPRCLRNVEPDLSLNKHSRWQSLIFSQPKELHLKQPRAPVVL